MHPVDEQWSDEMKRAREALGKHDCQGRGQDDPGAIVFEGTEVHPFQIQWNPETNEQEIEDTPVTEVNFAKVSCADCNAPL